MKKMKTIKWKQLKYVFLSVTWFISTLSLEAREFNEAFIANKDLKILTIGNSFANNALHYLSEITESVPGYNIIFTRANIGGASLEKHASYITGCEKNPALKPYYSKFCLKDLLEMENYDFITIQQTSSLSFVNASYQPFADTLIEFIKKYSPESKIIIHQTWAYSSSCPRLDEWNLSRDEMHEALVKNYNNLAKQYNLEILPSGNAFYSSFHKTPGIYLWKEDGYHANTNGSYLAGCVWFGKLFGVSPKKIKYVPDGMSPKTAKHLKNIAAKEVKEQKH